MMVHIKWKLIRWIFKYFCPIIKIFEKRAIKKHTKEESNYSPIFIIGAPRSGSTILFQLITSYFNFLYINNFINLARETTFIGFLLNHTFLKKKAHNSFESKFGDTSKDGLLAPNEGLFWYNWLPKNKYYVLPSEVSVKNKKTLKDTINAIMNKFDKPIILKNLAFSLKLELIRELFPRAKFIYLKREPIEIAQSIANVRLSKYGSIKQWWSLKPRNYNEIKKLPPEEQVAKQIYYIEKQIENDLKHFDKENILTIYYDELTEYMKVISKISNFTNQPYYIKKENKPSIKIKKGKKVPDEIYTKLLIEIEKLDWENYQG